MNPHPMGLHGARIIEARPFFEVISDKLEGFAPDTEELHTFANPTLSMVTAAKPGNEHGSTTCQKIRI